MCGFAGVVAFEESFRCHRGILERMSACVAHRGPDGQAVWINHHQPIGRERPQVSLAFRRLAVLDLSSRAMQPMLDGNRVLLFNGEIYNFADLRRTLDAEHPGYAWRTTGDTEVILRAYAAWGAACVKKFNGMFALALWDGDANTLLLARDPVGQKPLYYTVSKGNGAIAFASELPALRQLPWANQRLYGLGLRSYLEWGCLPADMTIYYEMHKLLPGHVMTCGANGPAPVERYFDVNDIESQSLPRTEAPRRARELVLEAVKRQLVADVPVGCFLSGGIDSSVIAYAMCQAAGTSQAVMTFNIAFDDRRYDESQYAAAVAKALGTTHRSFTIKADAAADLPKIAAAFGEPFADSSALATHYLSREARQHVTVALSGDGGDELFGGYDRYRAMQLARKADGYPTWIWPLLARLRHKHRKGFFSRVGRFARSIALPAPARYASYLRLFSDAQIANLVGPDGARVLLGEYQDIVTQLFIELNADRDDVAAALAVDRLIYLPDDPLVKVDRTSMLHALEVRSPLLDPDVVRFAAGLKMDQIIEGGPKRMLREAFAADLPAIVFSRPKMGFAIPIGQWLRTSLRPMLHDLLTAQDSLCNEHFRPSALAAMMQEHESGQEDHAQRLYALLMLELWRRDQKSRGG